jgi:hypothetical protein
MVIAVSVQIGSIAVIQQLEYWALTMRITIDIDGWRRN